MKKIEPNYFYDEKKKKMIKKIKEEKVIRNIEDDEKVLQMIENVEKDLDDDDYTLEQKEWRSKILNEALKRKNESLKKGSSLLPIGRMIKHRYTVGLKREEERYGKSKRELMDGYDYLMKNYLLYKEKAKNSRTLEERKKYIQKSENYHNKAKRILTKFTFL